MAEIYDLYEKKYFGRNEYEYVFCSRARAGAVLHFDLLQ